MEKHGNPKRYTRGERIRFQPRDCPVCGKQHPAVILDADKYYRWISDQENIQNVFPEMSAAEREILISGTCADCWKELFNRCVDEDLELENTPKNEIPMTAAEAEEMERKQMDRMNAAVELMRVRDEYVWSQRELEQRAKDQDTLDAEEERRREEALEEWIENTDEWNTFYSTDPLCPNSSF